MYVCVYLLVDIGFPTSTKAIVYSCRSNLLRIYTNIHVAHPPTTPSVDCKTPYFFTRTLCILQATFPRERHILSKERVERHQATKNTVFLGIFWKNMFIISFSKTSHRFWTTEISRSKTNIYIVHLDCNSCELRVLQSCPACSLMDWQCLKIWIVWLCSPSEMVPGSARSAIMSSLCFLQCCRLFVEYFTFSLTSCISQQKDEHDILIY